MQVSEGAFLLGIFLKMPCDKRFWKFFVKKIKKTLLHAKKVFAMVTTVFIVVRIESGIKCLLKRYLPNM